MEWFACQDPRSYSFHFDLNIFDFTGTFQKRAPGRPGQLVFRVLGLYGQQALSKTSGYQAQKSKRGFSVLE